MAFSAHKTAEAMEELYDSDEQFTQGVQAAVDLIRKSPHTVFYTGAGISTSAGIPDYRGPDGVWTLAAKGARRVAPTTDMMKAIPTPTHMAIMELIRKKMAHHVISQNVDGLHRKSGVLPQDISELHGNSNVEVCSDCGRQYLRDYHVSSVSRDHSTGQLCEMPGCGGILKDNIINFHENLVPEVLNRAFKESQVAGLHICLGSSLTVRPACELPKCTKECGGKVIIVNLQRTPLDYIADVRIHRPVDQFMIAVMHALSTPIPSFELERRIVMWRDHSSIQVSGVEADGMPASVIRSLKVRATGEVIRGPQLPLTISWPSMEKDAVVECSFFGHYNEPDVSLTFAKEVLTASYSLTLNPLVDDAWKVCLTDCAAPDFSPVQKIASGPKCAPRLPQVTDFTGWHAVTPLDDCPHTHECGGFRPNQVIDLEAPCVTCGNIGENMTCLTCGVIACGRHVASHMLAHHEATGHSMVCGFMDISFWCYKCDAYISPSNPRVRPQYCAIHLAKFGCVPFA
jgi:mono-ADP-ribosyltransferase sirtuin 6